MTLQDAPFSGLRHLGVHDWLDLRRRIDPKDFCMTLNYRGSDLSPQISELVIGEAKGLQIHCTTGHRHNLGGGFDPFLLDVRVLFDNHLVWIDGRY